MRSVMNIAIFLPNWIGDAVMATPAVRALRDRYRDARITVVVRPYVAGVFSGCDWFDDVIFMRGKSWQDGTASAAMKLRKHDVDLAVLFPNSFRAALTAWLGGCKRRIGYARYGRSALLTDALQPVRDEAGKLKPSPVIDAYNLLAVRPAVLIRASKCVYPPRQKMNPTPTPSGATPDYRAIERLFVLIPAPPLARPSTGRPTTLPLWPATSP